MGRVTLYLLDSNDPLNSPVDRGITAKLYGGGHETRFLQEVVLGVGGWRALEALGLDIDVCHLNEGHAAFVVIERARSFSKKTGVSFPEALWATRGGNVFTTHTPVPAGFDTFDGAMLKRFQPYVNGFREEAGESIEAFMALGRRDPADQTEPFNMAYLAMRGASVCNAVSQLHGAVSRRLFRDLFPRRPEHEVPIGSITNGVHMPSWDSALADELWTQRCGKERWRLPAAQLCGRIGTAADDELWTLRARQREKLIAYLRNRIQLQLGHRGIAGDALAAAGRLFDPNALTIGFARRFAEYKRPTLLIKDPGRLLRLLTDPARPVQLVVAGKAHPADEEGKAMIRDWVEFANLPAARHHVAFVEDYDISVASALVQGVDVWLNTPRRPWEACGTSGMKALVNGGLNLSELDGWWAEAWTEDVGWALGDREEHDASYDDVVALQLYELLENEVVPCFYERDPHGLPQRWIRMIRASLTTLAPHFSAGRMVQEYVERIYQPAAAAHRERTAGNAALGRELSDWEAHLRRTWKGLHIGRTDAQAAGDGWRVSVPVYLGETDPDAIAVELYADPGPDETPCVEHMCRGEPITGAARGFIYTARLPATRPVDDYTARIVPFHAKAFLPAELPLVHWQR